MPWMLARMATFRSKYIQVITAISCLMVLNKYTHIIICRAIHTHNREDLIELRQRKRLSKRLIRDAKKNKLWFETKLTKGFSPLSSRSKKKLSVWPWSLKSG